MRSYLFAPSPDFDRPRTAQYPDQLDPWRPHHYRRRDAIGATGRGTASGDAPRRGRVFADRARTMHIRGAGIWAGPFRSSEAARREDVPVYLDGLGTIKALNTAVARAQVDGQLVKISFREGQDVPRGYVLAEIDPRTYQAQLHQTTAKLAQDQAQLANAKLDLDR